MSTKNAERGPYFKHPLLVKIRERCGALDINQSELARHMGYSHATGNRWFSGETFPTRDQVKEIEDSLDLDRGELLVLGGYLPGDKATFRRRDDGGLIIEIEPGSIAPRARSSSQLVLAVA